MIRWPTYTDPDPETDEDAVYRRAEKISARAQLFRGAKEALLAEVNHSDRCCEAIDRVLDLAVQKRDGEAIAALHELIFACAEDMARRELNALAAG